MGGIPPLAPDKLRPCATSKIVKHCWSSDEQRYSTYWAFNLFLNWEGEGLKLSSCVTQLIIKFKIVRKMANSVIVAPQLRHFYWKSGSPSQNPTSELLLDDVDVEM